MRSDVGETLVAVADIIRGFGLFLTIVGGILIILLGEFVDIEWSIAPTGLGVIIGIFGSVSVWLISLLFRGFGTLIIITGDIKELLIKAKEDKN